MKRHPHAQAAGVITPTRDEGPTVSAVAPQESKQFESPDFRCPPHAGQALRVIEGERKAADYLARLHAQQADPDELALTISMLYGAVLRGFCRRIEKALGVHHA